MPITISCPSCRKPLRLPENMLGKQVRCPGCQNVFTAASPEEPPQPAEELESVQERPSQRPRPRREEDDQDYDREPRRRDYVEDDDEEIVRGKPHRGTLILTLGILGVVLSCCPLAGWILGGIALSMSGTDLQLMARGQMDPTGKGPTQAGKILGIIAVILATITFVVNIILGFGRVGKF